MIPKVSQKSNYASLLLKILGDKIPEDVYRNLSAKEIERLNSILDDDQHPGIKEENQFLKFFNSILSETEHEKPEYLDILSELRQKNSEELSQIIQGESARIISLVLFFANPDEVATLMVELPDKLLSDVVIELQNIDYHSEIVRNELERFLKFKIYLLKKKISPARIKDGKSKKMAEILSGLTPNTSLNLFEKIKESSPLFAENIEEHYYSFQDLLKMNRAVLSHFFQEFHPLVLATAFKGVDMQTSAKLISSLEPWYAKLVKTENDSMGPVSLGEIEAAQKGILSSLATMIESGKIRLWKGQSNG
ncbi:MAG: hypothetical protein OEZ34_15330 [Spirochaetia bacterium]|nr:hypothetical protein [Spirochaetia bacterium]